MPKYQSWLQTGATWKESIKDFQEIRPKESFTNYRVLKSEGDQLEIEQQTRDWEGNLDTNSTNVEELLSDGALLETDPEQGECIEINCDEHFMEKFENISLDTGARPTYKFIRKKREDCPRCSGGGECSDCSASGECSVCGSSGTCGNCSGEGKCTNCENGKCDFCEGTGKCSSCEGMGRSPGDPDPCSECNGSGRCPDCSGSRTCPTCRGSRRCNECLGNGKCSHCHGSTRCAYCNGNLKCRDCGGTGKAMITSEYWYDQVTGLLLKHVSSVNKKPVTERIVLTMNISSSGFRPPGTSDQQPYQRSYQPGGTLTIEETQPIGYNNPAIGPAPGPGAIPPPSVCPFCSRDLRSTGATVFCPFCGGRLAR